MSEGPKFKTSLAFCVRPLPIIRGILPPARTSSNRFSLLPPRGVTVYVILLSLSVVALLALVPVMYVYRTGNMQTMKSAVAHVGQIRHETGAMDVKNMRFTAAVAVDVATQQ